MDGEKKLTPFQRHQLKVKSFIGKFNANEKWGQAYIDGIKAER